MTGRIVVPAHGRHSQLAIFAGIQRIESLWRVDILKESRRYINSPSWKKYNHSVFVEFQRVPGRYCPGLSWFWYHGGAATVGKVLGKIL